MGKNTTKETVDENLFGAFKFIDQAVPKKANKIETDEPEPVVEDETEQEKIAKAEALAAAEKKSKTVKPEVDEAPEVGDEPEVETEIEDEPETNGLAIFAKELSEKGLLELGDEDKIESDEDLFKAYQKTIKKAVEEDRTGRPEDAQRFLEFLDNGGDPKEFHKLYYGDGATFEEFQMESEEDQEYVTRQALELEGLTAEEIDDEIADLKDLGKLDKKAAIHLRKLQKIEKEQKKALLESQKEHAKKLEERKLAEWTEFKKGLFEKEEISGFKFNDKMKNDTWDYMTKIVDRKQGLTQYQIDSQSNPDARYMFAYLLRNKWDIKALEKQVTTKAVSKLATKLNNYTDSRSKITKGTTAKNKDDGSNPFAGFRDSL